MSDISGLTLEELRVKASKQERQIRRQENSIEALHTKIQRLERGKRAHMAKQRSWQREEANLKRENQLLASQLQTLELEVLKFMKSRENSSDGGMTSTGRKKTRKQRKKKKKKSKWAQPPVWSFETNSGTSHLEYAKQEDFETQYCQICGEAFGSCVHTKRSLAERYNPAASNVRSAPLLSHESSSASEKVQTSDSEADERNLRGSAAVVSPVVSNARTVEASQFLSTRSAPGDGNAFNINYLRHGDHEHELATTSHTNFESKSRRAGSDDEASVCHLDRENVEKEASIVENTCDNLAPQLDGSLPERDSSESERDEQEQAPKEKLRMPLEDSASRGRLVYLNMQRQSAPMRSGSGDVNDGNAPGASTLDSVSYPSSGVVLGIPKHLKRIVSGTKEERQQAKLRPIVRGGGFR